VYLSPLVVCFAPPRAVWCAAEPGRRSHFAMFPENSASRTEVEHGITSEKFLFLHNQSDPLATHVVTPGMHCSPGGRHSAVFTRRPH